MTKTTPRKENTLLFLKGDEIIELLKNREQEVLDAVRNAYMTHAANATSMPPNGYLRFPGMEKERIIAKPAWLGGAFNTAGIKWIASFPKNRNKNLDRASATLILNSTDTGHPIAVMESSIISAYRTAASAALAAQILNINDSEAVKTVGLVGCGYINYETLRFLLAIFPNIQTLLLHDLSSEMAQKFAQKAKELKPDLKAQFVKNFSALLPLTNLISFATTAVHPFVKNIDGYQPGTILLHISLRDLVPAIILNADNIVDDIDQVCSNQTSLHLAEQQIGNRDFIRSTIGDIFNGHESASNQERDIHIFSPFGLGILDMALGHLVQKLAIENQIGMQIENFLPKSWLER